MDGAASGRTAKRVLRRRALCEAGGGVPHGLRGEPEVTGISDHGASVRSGLMVLARGRWGATAAHQRACCPRGGWLDRGAVGSPAHLLHPPVTTVTSMDCHGDPVGTCSRRASPPA